MEDDWDLHAVVRGCSGATTTSFSDSGTGSSSTAVLSSSTQDYSFPSASFQDLFEPRGGNFVEELQEFCKPFIPKSHHSLQNQAPLSPPNFPISPLSVLVGLQDLSPEKKQVKKASQQKQNPQPFAPPHTPTPRSKRRKTHLKKVRHVAAESLSCDMWSWRKYGQKPIKGSPYPRGYYRCSTSKGCTARKQVERNRSDPGMFIVTYTGEHNHLLVPNRSSFPISKSDEPNLR